jgi:hypothetical protein
MYLIRQRLGFSRQEWDRLPWHDQQMYVDGLMEELGIPREDETANDFEDDGRPPVESLPREEPAVPANVGGPDPDMALMGMGFTVQRTTFAGG